MRNMAAALLALSLCGVSAPAEAIKWGSHKPIVARQGVKTALQAAFVFGTPFLATLGVDTAWTSTHAAVNFDQMLQEFGPRVQAHIAATTHGANPVAHLEGVFSGITGREFDFGEGGYNLRFTEAIGHIKDQTNALSVGNRFLIDGFTALLSFVGSAYTYGKSSKLDRWMGGIAATIAGGSQGR